MGWFMDINYNYTDAYVRVSIDAKPDDVFKHYMLSPDFDNDLYMTEITSYKDLQEFSKRGRACIGHEKPVYHLRERIPSVMSAAYDPHIGKTYDKYVYVVGYWPWPPKDPPGYYVIAHPSGFEDFTFYGDSYSSTMSIRGEVYKAVRHGGGLAYIFISVGGLRSKKGLPTYITEYDPSVSWAYSVSAEAYADAESIIASFETLSDAKASEYWDDGAMVMGQFDPARSRNWYVGNWINESDLFDPKQDLELVSTGHAIPAGLDAKLVSEAIAQTSFNSNSIANLLDLFDAAVDIKNGDIGSLLLDFKKGVKVSADAWLKYRYVYSTTKSDLEELKRYASNGEPTICRAGEQTSGGKMQMKIKLAPKSDRLGQTVDRLTREGLAPNAYNMWDLIPFSFVADWFIGVGDFLEGITQYGRCAAYDIEYVTTSWTWKAYLEKSRTRAEYTFYERTVSPSAPAYVPYVESRSASGSTILKRCADTVALIGG